MEKYLLDAWPGESTLEEVDIWGIEPLFLLNEVFDILHEEEIPVTKSLDTFFYYDNKSKLLNLREVLVRYDLYLMMLKRRLEKLSPDDPLFKDPVGLVKAEIVRREKRMELIKAGKLNPHDPVDRQIITGLPAAEVEPEAV